MVYSTSTEVGSFLQTTFDGTTTPTATAVTAWITESDERIDRRLGFTYETAVASDFLVETNGIKEIWLPRDKTPIISVADLELNTGSEFDSNFVSKTEGTDFLLIDLEIGRIRFANGSQISSLYNGLKIGTLTYGYSSVPESIKELSTLITAKKVLQSAMGKTSNQTNEAISVGPITIRSSVGESVRYVQSLNMKIDSLWTELGNVRSHFY